MPAVDTIALFSAKGGSGKSTVTVLLAEMLASSLHGKRILVVDNDPQQSSAVALLGDAARTAALRAGKTLNRLLQPILAGQAPHRDFVLPHLVRRTRPPGTSRNHFLKGLAVLPAHREGWHALNDELARTAPAPDNGTAELPPYLPALRDALAVAGEDFDVCLIDFPANNRGPLVCVGLWAADRWLFPVQPDRVSTRDVDSSLAILRRAHRDRSPIKRMGTLLTLCPHRASGTYRTARHCLERLAERRSIPPLFGQDAELPFSLETKRALDDTCEATTLRQKFGPADGVLYRCVSALAAAVLQRLKRASDTANPTNGVNSQLTTAWASG
jgi:cellulose biosynthesis protein BcsQ